LSKLSTAHVLHSHVTQGPGASTRARRPSGQGSGEDAATAQAVEGRQAPGSTEPSPRRGQHPVRSPCPPVRPQGSRAAGQNSALRWSEFPPGATREAAGQRQSRSRCPGKGEQPGAEGERSQRDWGEAGPAGGLGRKQLCRRERV